MSQSIRWPDVLGRLNRAVRNAGGESAFAQANGLTRQEVHEAMKGNRHPGPAMLAAVGVRRVVSYELTEAALATAEQACGQRTPDAKALMVIHACFVLSADGQNVSQDDIAAYLREKRNLSPEQVDAAIEAASTGGWLA